MLEKEPNCQLPNSQPPATIHTTPGRLSRQHGPPLPGRLPSGLWGRHHVDSRAISRRATRTVLGGQAPLSNLAGWTRIRHTSHVSVQWRRRCRRKPQTKFPDTGSSVLRLPVQAESSMSRLVCWSYDKQQPCRPCSSPTCTTPPAPIRIRICRRRPNAIHQPNARTLAWPQAWVWSHKEGNWQASGSLPLALPAACTGPVTDAIRQFDKDQKERERKKEEKSWPCWPIWRRMSARRHKK